MASRSWSSAERPTRAARLLTRLPAAILIVVAATQMTLARVSTLSAWKGGGFGMFASLDGLPFRELRIVSAAGGRSVERELPEALAEAGARVAAFPHERALRALAAAVIADERANGRAVETVRVEVWRTHLSSVLDSTAVKLCDLSVRVNADADTDAERETKEGESGGDASRR